MKKVRVLFLGSRPLGLKALRLLRSLSNVEITGVVTQAPTPSAWWSEDPYFLMSEAETQASDLSKFEFDIGISVNYWKLIPEDILQIPKLGFLNIHHSYNLCIRGRNCATQAILRSRPENKWFHGTTLHYMSSQLDSGPVIASASCSITELDTAWTLFHKTEELALDLLREWLPRSLNGRLPSLTPDNRGAQCFRNDQVDSLIKDPHEDPLATYDKVRAFDFNHKRPPAFMVKDGKKVWLTTEIHHAREAMLTIDNQRKVYFSQAAPVII